MKYLKLFNESLSEDEIADIKDIFQDLIDEFDIEYFDDNDNDNYIYSLSGIYYNYNTFKYKISTGIKFYIYLFSDDGTWQQLTHMEKFKLFYSQLENFKQRLNLIGCNVDYIDNIKGAYKEIFNYGFFEIKISKI